jgi:hypothetical protein
MPEPMATNRAAWVKRPGEGKKQVQEPKKLLIKEGF